MKYRFRFFTKNSKISIHLFILLAVLLGMIGGTALTFAAREAAKDSQTTHVTNKDNAAPTPFMHRPYYGSRTILQRTVSYVDHDKPWYENDGVFVRYDGAKWTNVSIGSCTAGVNCYDGHNGYDLNLWYEPVLSVAAGTVIRAGWYNPLDHNSSLGLWAAIDHGNGYVTAYGHLSALTVSMGESVGVQWQIGTSGTTGSSTGPHLHMATYYLPYWNATDPFGWTGNYPDPNVVPDNYLWVNDPGTSSTIPLLSSNGSALYPGATLVDDGGVGWSSTGSWNVATSSADIGGNLHWTSTSSGAATATANWQPHLTADGYYEVGVFVDSSYASSSWAPYTIYSDDPNHPGTLVSHSVAVDESHIGSFQGPFSWENTGPQWVGLGTYYFRASSSDHVVLSNATGENGAQLAADGMEFVPVSVSATLPPALYRFAVSQDTAPAALLANNTTPVSVTLKNTSNFSWQATGSNAVQVVYRWLNAQNSVVANGTAALSQNVAVGASATINVPVHTPAAAGLYTLQWDMEQGNTAFSQQGAQVKNDSVEVAGAFPQKTYYFAEGYTGAGTTEYLSLVNPSATTATISVTYLYSNAAEQTRTYSVPAQSHSVLNINTEAGANQSVGMIVQGNQPFVAERTMYTQKGGLVAASDSMGSTTLSTSWYFAEGNTTYGWNTLLSVLNPSSQSASIKVTYLLNARGQSGFSRQGSTYTIAAHSRGTIILNRDMPNAQFGMVVSASIPVVIERPEYLDAVWGTVWGSNMRGGSSVLGATAPQTSWYFGAGNTSPGYTERLVLANPLHTWANAQINYLLFNGQIITQSVGVPGQSRIEVNVNDVVKQALHATVVTANSPIVAERQDFFATPSFIGSTTVMGSSSAHTSWYLAQGDTTNGRMESLALANPNATATSFQVIYYQAPGKGAPIIKNYTLAANSHMTITLATEVGANSAVGMAIFAAEPVVVEQSMFFNVSGASGGYASMGDGV